MVKKFNYKLVTKQGEYKGAVKVYKTAKGDVAVGFTTTNAFIMEDSQGLYELADMKYNIEKLGLDAQLTKEALSIASVEGCVIDVAERLGLSGEDMKDIVDTVKALSEELECFDDK